MRGRWSRGSLIVATAAAAALALAGCGAGVTPEPSTASDPPNASGEPESGAPGDAGSPALGADAPRPNGPEACEPALLHLYGAESPERGRIDDQVQVHGVVDMLFPTAPTCTISYVQGEQRWVIMAWFDEPETAGAVIDELTAKGWTASEAEASGYTMTTLSDGEATVEVHPTGTDERGVRIGQFPEGVDLTMVNVLLP